MSIEKLAPEYLFLGKGELLKDKVLIHEKGKIIEIVDIESEDRSTLRELKGIICPGFINTHCHLELSHMKGRIDTGTGLLPFISAVVQYRDIHQEEIDAAIVAADAEMKESGIVAVGDISNKIDTAGVKSYSDIAYCTFVEMFDFIQPQLTPVTIEQYQEVYIGQSDHGLNEKSYSPHAPYTVSSDLFSFINANNSPGSTVSIHNQETIHEDQLFLAKEGGFIDFYKDFGFSLDHFKKTKKTAIHYAMQHMDPSQRTLMVHNTRTTIEDYKAAMAWNEKVYWATCANANLYIENYLPNYEAAIEAGAIMTIGTDSLSSNWQLSILEEIKTIRKHKSFLSLTQLLTWATSNGAEALGYEHHFGSFIPGRTPGINLIKYSTENGILIDLKNAMVKRLA